MIEPRDMVLLGEKIRAFRGLMSASKAARRYGISARTLRNIETAKAKDVLLGTLIRIANAHGTSVTFLIGQEIAGVTLHPDAFMIGVLADQRIKRIADNLIRPGWHNQEPGIAGKFVELDAVKRKPR